MKNKKVVSVILLPDFWISHSEDHDKRYSFSIRIGDIEEPKWVLYEKYDPIGHDQNVWKELYATRGIVLVWKNVPMYHGIYRVYKKIHENIPDSNDTMVDIYRDVNFLLKHGFGRIKESTPTYPGDLICLDQDGYEIL